MNNDKRAAAGRLFFYLGIHPVIGPLEGGAGGTRPRKRGSGHTPKRPAPKHHAQAAKGRARPARP